MPNPSPEKVEVLKVWYSVFCAICDTRQDGEYDDATFLRKVLELREKLAEAIPSVEQEMARYHQ